MIYTRNATNLSRTRLPLYGGGGLALLWKDDFVFHTSTMSPNHIDVFVSNLLQVLIDTAFYTPYNLSSCPPMMPKF